jgi:small subunit ribosomal protein S18
MIYEAGSKEIRALAREDQESNQSHNESEESRPPRRSRRPARRERGARGKRRFSRRRHCSFCANKVTSIDYKKSDALRSYLTDRGKIKPRRRTGTCAKHQRQLAAAIKRARHMALLPYVVESGR